MVLTVLVFIPAERVTAVLPCFPYARQDKKDKSRSLNMPFYRLVHAPIEIFMFSISFMFNSFYFKLMPISVRLQ